MTARTRVLAAGGALLLTAALTACAQKGTPSTSLGHAPGQPGVGNVQNTPGGQGNAPVPQGSTTPAPHPSASSSSSGSGGSGGGITIHPSWVFTLRPPVITVQDCISYNPSALTIVNQGADGFLITDGSSAMLILDTVADADTAVALLHNYNQQCFIGRSNSYTGSERYRHIVDYWQGSGVPGSSVPTPDCLSYDNTTLSINNLGGTDGYQLVDASQALVLTETLADANAAKALAAAHHQLCFIGRSNSRADRYEYIVEYWI